MKYIRKIACFFIVLNFVILVFNNNNLYAKEPVVIVIDPGHGGENLGAEYGSYTEKDMTMVVARAMKEELEKYEGVEVYLTHESAEDDMSLLERVEFAEEKNADFLFCLHFNMSVNHNLFGAEVWVSAFGDCYAKAYSFAEIEMEMLTGLGLYSRGIKTKLNDKGDNYYGILRHGNEKGIPTALIEHCHLDQGNDKPFYTQGNEQLEAFGRLDAAAAAKYFKLHSEELGVDYGDYPVSEIEIPKGPVKPDMTGPDVCNLELVSLEEDTGEVTLTLKAEDYDSYILYYNYSLDGGSTYFDLERFPKEESEVTFTVTIPSGEDVELRVNAYNGFDVWTESNIIEVAALHYDKEPEPIAEEKEYQEISLDEVTQQMENAKKDAVLSNTIYIVLIVVLVSLMVLCMAILVMRIMLIHKKKKGKQKKDD